MAPEALAAVTAPVTPAVPAAGDGGDGQQGGEPVVTVSRELLVLGPAFAGLMVFLVYLAVSTKVGADKSASAPDLTSAAGALAALVLGLVINPRRGRGRTLQSVAWAACTLAALGVGAFAAVQVFDTGRTAAGAALTGALAAFGGLFVDATKITHTAQPTADAQSAAGQGGA